MIKQANLAYLMIWFCIGIQFQTSCSQRTHKTLLDLLGQKRVVCTFNSVFFYNKMPFTPRLIDPRKCTHINYQFAILDETTYELAPGSPQLDIEKNFYKETTDLKMKIPDLKVLLSIGGWKDSTSKYSDLVASKEKRDNFIKKVIDFLNTHRFDGLDVAWEYPNGCQGSITDDGPDKENYATFLQELKDAFTDAKLVLSASVAAAQHEIEAAYDVPTVAKTVDYLNVMTFDMHGPWEKITGHHAQFSPVQHDTQSLDVMTALKTWTTKGAPPEKLNIGIPAYGRSFTLSDPNKYGYGNKTESEGNPGPDTNMPGYLSYKEICHYLELTDDAWVEHDDAKMGPYAYHGDQWVCYDSPKQVIRKVKHTIEEGYGGVMLKDVSSDDYTGECFNVTYPLLDMIVREIHKCVNEKANSA